jgi:hypothetical protein
LTGVASQGDAGRLARAIAALDALNAADPRMLSYRGELRPRELLQSELATEFLRRLAPDAGEALQLAARAHHLRRWEMPRSRHPAGRQGYHRWRRELQDFHARALVPVLEAAGYGHDAIQRVQALVRKQDLGSDPEVQHLEDALCLVFLQTELEDVAERLPPERLSAVLARTLRKMSARGREEAQRCELSPRARELLARALAALG